MIEQKEQLDSSATVNEVIAMYPDAISVFNSFGIDMCCGGDDRLDTAAQNANVEAADLLSALRQIIVPSDATV